METGFSFNPHMSFRERNQEQKDFDRIYLVIKLMDDGLSDIAFDSSRKSDEVLNRPIIPIDSGNFGRLVSIVGPRI
jgi:hypothetical protein